jgi:hypothetical protein
VRTTLDIDDDLLIAAKELARRERTSAGKIVSRMLREALTSQKVAPGASARRRPVAGFKPFTALPGIVTDEEVNALRDAEGI